MIDHEELGVHALALKLEAELLLKRGEERDAVGGLRERRTRLRVGAPVQADVEGSLEAGAIDDGPGDAARQMRDEIREGARAEPQAAV